uniref:THAP-type domain-containing protein n=1 Tax=Rhipicephalus appendiculatus TaxID=34631 RepID=A0A131YHG9_RHIAP
MAWRKYSRCDVAGCKGDGSERIHRVPDDAERRQTWLRLIGWPDSRQRERIFVCGRHFSADDYTQNQGVMQAMGFQPGRPCLNKDAVPSLFLPSIPPHAMDAQSSQRAATSAASSSSFMDVPPALVCQCSCRHPVRASVTTQCSLGMEAARDIDERPARDIGVQCCDWPAA